MLVLRKEKRKKIKRERRKNTLIKKVEKRGPGKSNSKPLLILNYNSIDV